MVLIVGEQNQREKREERRGKIQSPRVAPPLSKRLELQATSLIYLSTPSPRRGLKRLLIQEQGGNISKQ